MSTDSTASFSEIAGGVEPSSCRLVTGFVSGRAGRELPVVRLEELDALEVTRGGQTAFRRRGAEGALDLADRWVSTPHARLVRDRNDWSIEDAGAKNALFLNGERVQKSELVDGDVIELGASVLVFREAGRAPARRAPVSAGVELLTNNPQLESAYSELRQVAASDVPILVNGETGTGKELVADFVHRHSRRKGDLHPVNCAAIPAAMAESLLFGHKKGAFSGAVADSPGVLRAAEGGTLFLDEVAELELPVQAKLLRVLQEGLVTPLGGTRAIPVNVRVVSATHVDLESLVAQGKFRQDLLARLAGYRARLPALRDRKEDLGLLVGELLRRRFAEAESFLFERAALRALYLYDWPHNVRELDHVLRTSVLQSGQVVTFDSLPENVRKPPPVDRPSFPTTDVLQQELSEKLTQLLRHHHGNVSAVARDLGKARVQIRRWCRRFNLDPTTFRHDSRGQEG
jgi:DNA-binding NtrC family response regulator